MTAENLTQAGPPRLVGKIRDEIGPELINEFGYSSDAGSKT